MTPPKPRKPTASVTELYPARPRLPQEYEFFEGAPVVGAKVSGIRGLIAVINRALTAMPIAVAVGERIFVGIECEINDVDHARVGEEGEERIRVHGLDAYGAFVATGELADLMEEAVDKAREAERVLRDRKAGYEQTFTDPKP